MFDVIGDIHGYAAELIALLLKMGYQKHGIGFRHPERKAVFVGDFIDRGPEIAECLAIVRAMVDAGDAWAVMGNHEFNALCFHTPDHSRPIGGLREHSHKNIDQHGETLRQLSSTQLKEYLAWFRTLPLYLQLDGLRVVHACWDQKQIEVISDRLAVLPV